MPSSIPPHTIVLKSQQHICQCGVIALGAKALGIKSEGHAATFMQC